MYGKMPSIAYQDFAEARLIVVWGANFSVMKGAFSYLPPLASGEEIWCQLFSEPAAGSDVASMLSTARREGDVYMLNGQKNWISYATVADHQLVFAKTDPSAK